MCNENSSTPLFIASMVRIYFIFILLNKSILIFFFKKIKNKNLSNSLEWIQKCCWHFDWKWSESWTNQWRWNNTFNCCNSGKIESCSSINIISISIQFNLYSHMHIIFKWKCQADHFEVVETLIAHGADLEHTNNKGETPIFIATQVLFIYFIYFCLSIHVCPIFFFYICRTEEMILFDCC